MRFQKTTEYAIRVMVFLASYPEQRFSVNVLHKKLNIPYKYLGRLMHTLSQTGMVEVEQGKHGGYKVNSNLDKIYLYQVIGAVEGLENYDRCILGFPECSDENPCPLHKAWLERREAIKEMIYNTTLADLTVNTQ